MTARRTLTWTIPGTPAEILRRLRDPEVAARRAAADPAVEAEVVELGGAEGELIMTIEASLPDAWVPAQVRSRIAARPRIVRRESWCLGDDGTAYGDIDVSVESVPATTMSSAGRLSPHPDDPGSSELHYLLTLTVALPVVGGVVERAVMEQICRGYDREARIIAES